MPIHLHRQLLPHIQSLLEQQAARGSSPWLSTFYQCTAAKPRVALSMLLMPLHYNLQPRGLGHATLGTMHPEVPGAGLRLVHSLQCLCWQQPQRCLCQTHPKAKAQTLLPDLYLQPQRCRCRRWHPQTCRPHTPPQAPALPLPNPAGAAVSESSCLLDWCAVLVWLQREEGIGKRKIGRIIFAPFLWWMFTVSGHVIKNLIHSPQKWINAFYIRECGESS